jgi:hypothetical protein
MNKIRKFVMLGAVAVALTSAFAFKSSHKVFGPAFFVDPTVAVSEGSGTITFTKIAPSGTRSCNPDAPTKVCEISQISNNTANITDDGSQVTITNSDYSKSESGFAYTED